MRIAFKGLRFGLMVGIGGGVLTSQPHSTFSGILLSAINTIKANVIVNESTLLDHLSILKRTPIFRRRRAGPNLLSKLTYNGEHNDTYSYCRVKNLQPRSKRKRGEEVTVYYGTIASSN
ncbi:hypothetical protein GGP41_000705 [Bipolaris sorokiniana]|uniref:Uncharacterized protein n=1 Tax=Cochliobolus sativus TaxID=45130 RepID=A0A8H6DY26_COCSA|nr:hypothetical protein GGP41_000705 [Bipolaris sorokiniana]